MRIVDCDYFVVGSGMSGLMTALHLAPAGKTVLVTKGRLEDCNSNFAQGGICCVADPADSFEAHVADTMIAGAGLCTEDVVRRIVSEAPAGIRDLIDCGVRFAKKDDGSWDLGREGGHSMRRIFHAGDITGEKCERAMIRTLRRHPAIDVREHTIVIDLVITARIGVTQSQSVFSGVVAESNRICGVDFHGGIRILRDATIRDNQGNQISVCSSVTGKNANNPNPMLRGTVLLEDVRVEGGEAFPC